MASNEFKSLVGKYAILKNNWNWGARAGKGDVIVVVRHTPIAFHYRVINSSEPNYPFKDVEWSGSENNVNTLEDLSKLEKLIYNIPD